MKFKAFSMAIVAGLVMATTVAAAPTKDIVDTAVDSKQFPTLVALVKQAGLVETLKGKGPFTVFAPTEEAFKALPEATRKAVTSDKELLKKVLLYHVVPGRIMARDAIAANGRSVDTALKGAKVDVRVRDGKVFIDGAQVVTTDIQATNGVIHVINKVIVPSDAELAAIASESKANKSGCSGCAGK